MSHNRRGCESQGGVAGGLLFVKSRDVPRADENEQQACANHERGPKRFGLGRGLLWSGLHFDLDLLRSVVMPQIAMPARTALTIGAASILGKAVSPRAGRIFDLGLDRRW